MRLFLSSVPSTLHHIPEARNATVCQQPSDEDDEARGNLVTDPQSARVSRRGVGREGRGKHVRAGDGGAHPGRGRGGVGCRRVRGGELDAGERDLGGARGEPARVEHPLPHGHGHLHDRGRRECGHRRGAWISNTEFK